jgi:hypothetical protein
VPAAEPLVLSSVAWGSLVLLIGGFAVGATLLERKYRRGLALLALATVGGFTFSFMAGFSIGRLTALLPLLVTAFATSRGRRTYLMSAAFAAAIALYVLLSWILAVPYWGIHIELALCLLAYLTAYLIPPRRVGGGDRRLSR